MAHLDTLKIYKEYLALGHNEISAQKETDILEHSFMTKVNELKSEFLSNKLAAFMGSLIIAIGGFTLAKMWDLSHDMTEVKTRLSSVENRMNSFEDKLDRR